MNLYSIEPGLIEKVEWFGRRRKESIRMGCFFGGNPAFNDAIIIIIMVNE